ncbi:hypothetical protein CP8484711_1080A, partial [Chlamydia psittaci 84-8471/1]|jgi:hypothetical protein
MKFG